MSKALTKRLYIYIGYPDNGHYPRHQKKFINRQCEIIARHSSGTCFVEFTDNGEKLNTMQDCLKEV